VSTKVSTVNQKKGAIAGRTVQLPHPPMRSRSEDPDEAERRAYCRWGQTNVYTAAASFA